VFSEDFFQGKNKFGKCILEYLFKEKMEIWGIKRNTGDEKRKISFYFTLVH
jgi:hypothetical protein